MGKIADEVRVKNFPVKMSPQLNQIVKVTAAKENVSMHHWVMQAIIEKLERDKAV